jgi:TPR repeat protein
MGERPNFIELNAKPLDPSSRLGLPSPRVLYNDGEIPPSLSPLDAFAAQSRMMAKQLDVEKRGENRMSRLPPAMVTKSLSQHRADRPTVFRSFSEESGGSRMRDEEGPGSSPVVAQPLDRHLSQHPRISAVPAANDDEADEDEGFMTPLDRLSTSESMRQPPTASGYFGLPRTDSPGPTIPSAGPNPAPGQAKADPGSSTSVIASGQKSHSRNTSLNSQLDPTFAISPPGRPAPHHESSDDDYTSSTAGSSFSFPRKLSSSSGISAPHSPPYPLVPVHPPRSPSVTSESSANGISAQRTHLNFSRPRSTASLSILSRTASPTPQRPITSHSRQTSAATQCASHASQAQPSGGGADLADNDASLSAGGSSYTYAKFSLPRGRMVSRDSAIFQGLSTPHFEWKEPLFQDTKLPSASSEKPTLFSSSPPRLTLDPRQDQLKPNETTTFAFDFSPARPTTPEKPVQIQPPTSASQSLQSASSTTSSGGRMSTETSDLKSSRPPAVPKPEVEDAKSTSSRSNSTLRPTSTGAGMKNAPGYHYMSPDDHVTKGIECHENGSLQESTYHLRIAAMQNHPTAMLLYALACRHGWGMRPNQREGVQWLRKALDLALLELAEDEGSSPATGVREFHDRKAKSAQFALSIYELGVSHLKGWGIEQDKALALRCFEVAGHWGDVDALTEAGFCYAEGVGCRKDLKKAAKFYRMAEQRGVSMVGNSW